jgi:hypothetical protein
MKQIDLPLVGMSTGLDSAMKMLRKSSRGALLSEDEGMYHLFTASRIAAARAQGIETLSAMKAHPKLKPLIVAQRPTGGADRVQLRYRRAPVGETRSVDKATHKLAVRPNRDYLVSRVAGKSAFLFVRSVNTASILVSGPTAYYCSRPVKPHSFSAADGVTLGDPCPRLDGYIIVAG